MKKIYWIVGICIVVLASVIAYKMFQGEQPTEVIADCPTFSVLIFEATSNAATNNNIEVSNPDF